MRRALRSRPSPALVIAIAALFLSLGGVSYGVATGSIDSREVKDNTIRSKDLRNNGATTKDIRNRTIRGLDVRNNSLAGAQINEATLGTVPRANTANSASTANTANSAATAESANRFGGMSARRFDAFTLTGGESRDLGTFGPFTLTATCTINEGGVDNATISITTSQDNSAYIGESEDADFDVGETIPYVRIQVQSGGFPGTDEDGALALGPDGTELFGDQLYAAVNTLGQVGTCRFGGMIFE